MNTRITIGIVALVAVVVAASVLGLGPPTVGPDLPTVVSITTLIGPERTYRQWSDGRLDVVTWNSAPDCGGQPVISCITQMLPGTTTFADVDRDGTVGITDFLAVLAAWDSGS